MSCARRFEIAALQIYRLLILRKERADFPSKAGGRWGQHSRPEADHDHAEADDWPGYQAEPADGYAEAAVEAVRRDVKADAGQYGHAGAPAEAERDRPKAELDAQAEHENSEATAGPGGAWQCPKRSSMPNRSMAAERSSMPKAELDAQAEHGNAEAAAKDGSEVALDYAETEHDSLSKRQRQTPPQVPQACGKNAWLCPETTIAALLFGSRGRLSLGFRGGRSTTHRCKQTHTDTHTHTRTRLTTTVHVCTTRHFPFPPGNSVSRRARAVLT